MHRSTSSCNLSLEHGGVVTSLRCCSRDEWVTLLTVVVARPVTTAHHTVTSSAVKKYLCIFSMFVFQNCIRCGYVNSIQGRERLFKYSACVRLVLSTQSFKLHALYHSASLIIAYFADFTILLRCACLRLPCAEVLLFFPSNNYSWLLTTCCWCQQTTTITTPVESSCHMTCLADTLSRCYGDRKSQ